jgi:hypothetical protein
MLGGSQIFLLRLWRTRLGNYVAKNLAIGCPVGGLPGPGEQHALLLEGLWLTSVLTCARMDGFEPSP